MNIIKTVQVIVSGEHEFAVQADDGRVGVNVVHPANGRFRLSLLPQEAQYLGEALQEIADDAGEQAYAASQRQPREGGP